MTNLYTILREAFKDTDAVRAGEQEGRVAAVQAREETRARAESLNQEVQLNVAKSHGLLVNMESGAAKDCCG